MRLRFRNLDDSVEVSNDNTGVSGYTTVSTDSGYAVDGYNSDEY